MASIEPLSPDALYHRADLGQFEFETTEALKELTEVIGQERAVDAVRFGIGIQQDGYNLFALGPNGTGKHTAVRQFIEKRAATMAVPDDWCYVHNFDQPHKPRALRLPAGRGVELSEDMKQLVEELQATVPAAFDSEEYHAQRQAIEEEFRERQESSFEELKEKAEKEDIALIQTPSGLAFAPMKEGEVINPQEFLSLPEEEQEKVQAEVEELQGELQRILRQIPQWRKENRERLKELNQEVAKFTVAPLFAELQEKFGDLPDVLEYLHAVQQDVVENVNRFLDQGQGSEDESPLAALMAARQQQQKPSFNQYEVNLLVDNSETEGAPIVYADLPTYQNLTGRVEHMSQMGALITNFTLIKPGALHEANGGYLLLDARKLLQQPYAYDGLKRALRGQEITIESLGQVYSLISTVSLEPEPVPLDVKVVLLGERMLYYLLVQHDPEFGELFKVMVDFENDIKRNGETNLAYARLIGTVAREEELRHFDREAVGRVIEHSARIVGDAEKLSTHMQSISDLLREANYWAGEAERELVTAGDVQQAIDAQIHRASRLRERVQESILRETILIDTAGEKMGQINGLAVFSLGNFMFGRPSRITARVWLGKGEVIDIERRVELGGPLHSKGVFILSSFLSARYAGDRPFALSGSLVFEQSYGGVDGDSASSAELYSLLSTLAEAPIRQSLAVTGSVNQHGEVQAIGGVNEKIEGFFDICRERGLTGSQGVLIPQANVKHLMLRRDVVDAVSEGQFHIYPVTHVDEGIELLTGIPAGEPDDEGTYPEGSINQRIVARLDAMAEKQRKFKTAPKKEADGDQDDDQNDDDA